MREALRSGAASMIAATLFSATGQLAFKVAGGSAGSAAIAWWCAGVAAYGPSLPLALRAYRKASLTRMFPLSGLMYVWTTIAAVAWFGEALSLKVTLGTTCVIAGAILVATSTAGEGAS